MKRTIVVLSGIAIALGFVSLINACSPMVIEKIVMPNQEVINHEKIDRRIGVLVGKGNTYKEIKIYYWDINKQNRWVWLADKVLEPAYLGNAFEYSGGQAYRVQMQIIELPQYGSYKFVVYPYYLHWFRRVYMDKYEYYLTINPESRLIPYGGGYVGWVQEIYIERPYGTSGINIYLSLPQGYIQPFDVSRRAFCYKNLFLFDISLIYFYTLFSILKIKQEAKIETAIRRGKQWWWFYNI